jgi:glycogen synthase
MTHTKNYSVIHVLTGAYPFKGGVASHVETLSASQQASGMSIAIVSRNSLQRWEQMTAKVVAFIARPFGIGASYVGYHYFLTARLRRLLRRLAAQKQPDIVHFHSGTKATIRINDIASVVTCHSDWVNELVGDGRVRRATRASKHLLEIEGDAYQRAHLTIAVDTRLAHHVRELSPTSQVEVVFNSVDLNAMEPEMTENAQRRILEDLHIPEHKVLVACPRRLVIKNGVEVAVRMMKMLPSEFHLVIAGDGPLRQELERLSDALSLRRSVTFTGGLERSAVYSLLAACPFTVIPSVTVEGLQEATSVAAIEAMNAASIVVASSIGGLRELITDGLTGALFPEGDAEAAAKRILAMSADLPLMNEIRAKARSTASSSFSSGQAETLVRRAYGEAMLRAGTHK